MDRTVVNDNSVVCTQEWLLGKSVKDAQVKEKVATENIIAKNDDCEVESVGSDWD